MLHRDMGHLVKLFHEEGIFHSSYVRCIFPPQHYYWLDQYDTYDFPIQLVCIFLGTEPQEPSIRYKFLLRLFWFFYVVFSNLHKIGKTLAAKERNPDWMCQ